MLGPAQAHSRCFGRFGSLFQKVHQHFLQGQMYQVLFRYHFLLQYPWDPHLCSQSPQYPDGEMLLEKAVGRGSEGGFPLLGYPRVGRKRAVSALRWRRCCAGRLEPGPPAPNLPPANKETLPCSKPQFLHWLKEEASLVQSLPSLGVPGSQKASSLFLTHRRYHFLEDLARCGPPGVSLLGQRAKILTRLRRGFWDWASLGKQER